MCAECFASAQVIALLLMDRPVSMHPDDIRDEKTKLMRALRVVDPADVVVGQYTASGDKPGYTDDEGVPNDSTTPTYAAIRLWCDNERWGGVPIIMKAGAVGDIFQAGHACHGGSLHVVHQRAGNFLSTVL